MRTFLPASLFVALPWANAGVPFVASTHRSTSASSGNLARLLSAQPEICEENGVAVTKRGSNYKPGAIKVLNQATTELTFAVEQIFDDSDQGGAWMSVVYKDEGGNYVCNQKTHNPMGYKRSFKAMCESTGVANIDVYVRSALWTTSNEANPLYSHTTPGACASWPSSNANTNVEVFSYRVACGVCDGCSNEDIPDVEVPFPDDEVCEGQGINVRYKDDDHYKPGAISILNQADTDVTFTLSQIYSDAPQGSLVSVVYKDPETESWTCEGNGQLLPETYKRSFKAHCEDTGVATVDVYVHNNDWTTNHVNPKNSDRPGECAIWPSGSSGVALFSYELSCGECADCLTTSPTTSPTHDGYCPDDIKLQDVDGVTMYPDLPIIITSQDEISVTFYIEQVWSEKAIIFTQLPTDVRANHDCYQIDEMEKHSRVEYTAICLQTAPITMVKVWVVEETFDPATDNAEIPECCHPEDIPSYPIVEYSFVISCESLCPETSRRQLRGLAARQEL